MPSVGTLPRERRRDPRFALPGTARVAVRDPAATVEGPLLDVSATGLRLKATDLGPLDVGTRVEVEVSVRDASDATRGPLIHLRGHGAVVRRVSTGRQSGELAIRLDGPLGFREYFSHVRVF
jgi:hypothetical protein